MIGIPNLSVLTVGACASANRLGVRKLVGNRTSRDVKEGRGKKPSEMNQRMPEINAVSFKAMWEISDWRWKEERTPSIRFICPKVKDLSLGNSRTKSAN